MKVKYKFYYIAIALVLGAVFCFFGAGSGLKLETDVRAEAVWSGAELNSEYGYGSELNIPEREVSSDGETVKADFVVYFPDGRATRVSPVKLDQVGRYTVEYTASAGGKQYAEKQVFTVNQKLYSFKSGSSASYGGYEYADPSVKGLNVSLLKGDTFSVLPLIDLNGATASDPFITLFVTPSKYGSVDFRKIFVTLTDSENPEIYMRVCVHSYPNKDDDIRSLCSAGFAKQPLSGHEAWSGKVHVNNNYGEVVDHSFSGRNTSGLITTPLNRYALKMCYDDKNSVLYISNKMIIEFDNPDHFDSPWTRGFPSGKVRLSITADDYNFPNANFMITQIRGLENLMSDCAEEVADETAPVISLDTDEEYPVSAPDAKTGVKYRVPVARAFDQECGETEVITNVYYNYVSENYVNIPVKDGAFVPDKTGYYAVKYTSQDRSGNVAERIVWIRAYNEIDEIEVGLCGEEISSAVMGEIVTVPSAEATGGSGNKTIAVTAENGETVLDITETKQFRAELSGEWTVRYVAADYIGQTGETSFKLSVFAGDKPLFIDKPVFPRYFIAGSTYELPEVYANDYSSGKLVRKKASGSVAINGDPVEVGSNGKFVPTAGGDCTVTYTYGNAEPLVKIIPVVEAFVKSDGNRLHMDNYLVGEGFTAARTSAGIPVTATSPDGGWTFANWLQQNNFSLTVAGVKGKSKFSALKIVLADYENEDFKLEMRLVNAPVVTLEVNGESLPVTGGFNAQSAFTVAYSNGKVTAGGASASVGFAGFPSGRIYFSVYFESAEIGSEYTLTYVGNQVMNSAPVDRIRPQVGISGSYGGMASVGDTRVLPSAHAGDVLTPNISFGMNVYAPDNSPVTSLDGVRLTRVDPTREYEIKFDMIGQYRVVYTTSDGNGSGSANVQYVINVEDKDAPVVTFKHAPQSTAKKGDVLVIPDFTVTDNYSAAEKITVNKCIITPWGEQFYLTDGNSVNATAVGKYELRVMATDEAGNSTMSRIVVEVTE